MNKPRWAASGFAAFGLLLLGAALLPSPASRPPRETLVSAAESPDGASSSASSVSPSEPVALRIPSLGIETRVIPVGQTRTGAMDAPRSATDVGWYRYGSLPGGTGSVVLTGHLDRADGKPAVFWRLGELRPGDGMSVRGENGIWLRYVVAEAAEYPYDGAPMERIFAGSGGWLSLITCAGEWSGRTYDKRLVVYARPSP